VVAPRDVTRPVVLIPIASTARLATALAGRLSYPFMCNEACVAVARMVSGRTTVATATTRLRGAALGRLRLRTTAAGRTAIRRAQGSRARRLFVTMTLTFTDPAGNRRTLLRRLTLRG
jgi:hypothetical protein